MKYLVLKTTDPYVNLAIEEYLFNNSDDCICGKTKTPL